jgi:hypothetical protein
MGEGYVSGERSGKNRQGQTKKTGTDVPELPNLTAYERILNIVILFFTS